MSQKALEPLPPERFQELLADSAERLRLLRSRSPGSAQPVSLRADPVAAVDEPDGRPSSRRPRRPRDRVGPRSESNCSWSTGCRRRIGGGVPRAAHRDRARGRDDEASRAASQASGVSAARRPRPRAAEHARAREPHRGGRRADLRRCDDTSGGKAELLASGMALPPAGRSSCSPGPPPPRSSIGHSLPDSASRAVFRSPAHRAESSLTSDLGEVFHVEQARLGP